MQAHVASGRALTTPLEVRTRHQPTHELKLSLSSCWPACATLRVRAATAHASRAGSPPVRGGSDRVSALEDHCLSSDQANDRCVAVTREALDGRLDPGPLQ
jgi:hypothetical protein